MPEIDQNNTLELKSKISVVTNALIRFKREQNRKPGNILN
jgi:hypothetical protein